MLINVSTLLQEPIGRARHYHVDHEPVLVADAHFSQEVTGDVRLIRSNRGVLVSASFDLAPVTLECARCLDQFETPVHVDFDEEYVVDRDPLTGLPVEADGDDFRIDAHRHLDLSEAVRQYEQSALPIRPVCRTDCRGLCPRCGQNLNHTTCGCSVAAADHRWNALQGLAERLSAEDGHGAPEA